MIQDTSCHHLKYQQNEYHQDASLANYVDYLPVESYSVITMKNAFSDYLRGDKSALAEIRLTLLSWHENSEKLPLLLKQNSRLLSLSAVVSDLKIFNHLALEVVERCISDDFYGKKEARTLDDKFIALQQASREIGLIDPGVQHCGETSARNAVYPHPE